MSESHQRQMQIFGEAPEHIIDSFSEQFEEDFMEHLKHT
jgi:DNA/RNA-binding protein KIN17